MIVGTVKEIKAQEHRVGLVPDSVAQLVAAGHRVVVQTGAGQGIGFTDDRYRAAGAEIAPTAAEVFKTAEMVVKVKEPQATEIALLRPDQVLFTYLHLAPDPEQAAGLMKSGCVAIAYETVTGADGRSLPLLAPMSEVAGRLSAQIGADYLMKHKGGLGQLIGGTEHTPPANVLVLGGGIAGFNAARVAAGMGGKVTILERAPQRIEELKKLLPGVAVRASTPEAVAELVKDAAIVIGAVLLPGASAPRLVTRAMLKTMRPGAVMVDIAIDQGGCFETSRVTTHADPVYVVDGITHYCVANMPGAVPLTSALALNQAVLPYTMKLANLGWRKAMAADRNLMAGLNVAGGQITHTGVSESLKLPYVSPETLLAG